MKTEDAIIIALIILIVIAGGVALIVTSTGLSFKEPTIVNHTNNTNSNITNITLTSSRQSNVMLLHNFWH